MAKKPFRPSEPKAPGEKLESSKVLDLVMWCKECCASCAATRRQFKSITLKPIVAQYNVVEKDVNKEDGWKELYKAGKLPYLGIYKEGKLLGKKQGFNQVYFLRAFLKRFV